MYFSYYLIVLLLLALNSQGSVVIQQGLREGLVASFAYIRTIINSLIQLCSIFISLQALIRSLSLQAINSSIQLRILRIIQVASILVVLSKIVLRLQSQLIGLILIRVVVYIEASNRKQIQRSYRSRGHYFFSYIQRPEGIQRCSQLLQGC